MKNILFLFSLILTLYSNSQVCLGSDTVVCLGQSVTINDCSGAGSGSGSNSDSIYTELFIPYNADPLNEGTQVTYNNSGNQVNLTDDKYSDTIPIGFNFCFWGNSYDKLVVSSNNYVTFHIDYANLSSPWQLQQNSGTTLFPIPLQNYPYNNSPKNAILGPWQDIYPNSGSNSIKYKVWGVAPYRRLSISWYNIQMFSCTSQLYSSQIILYETTNVIETHILDKPVCGTWNEGLATHGLINSDGTEAITVPGRNCTQWTTDNEGLRFTPTDNIVVWASTDGQTLPYNDGILTVSATSDTIGWFLKQISNCTGETGLSDTTWIYSLTPQIISTPVSCVGLSNGTATAEMMPPVGNITFQWNDPLNQTTATAQNLPQGVWNCLIQSDAGCSQTLTVTVGVVPGMITTLNHINPNCYGVNNGICTVTTTGGNSPYSYVWSNSTSSSSLANDLPSGLNTVTITDNSGCQIVESFTLVQPAPVEFLSISDNLLICSDQDTVLWVQPGGGNSPYQYDWTVNGVSVGNDSIINISIGQTQIYTITLGEECSPYSVDTTITVTIPDYPNLEIGGILESCSPAHFEIFNNTQSGDIDTVVWTFSNGVTHVELGLDSTSIDIVVPGNYSISMEVVSSLGCHWSENFIDVIVVNESPDADFSFSSNPTTFFETVISVTSQSSDNVSSWEWYSPSSSPTFSNTETSEFSFPQGEVAQYPITLTVYTDAGCFDTITKFLEVIADVAFYAPNVFTPNGDEHNQNWDIIVNGIDIQSFNLQVFNRWGEIVWETNDPNTTWDGTYGGTNVSDGVYFWTAVVGDISNDAKYKFSGQITVAR